MQLSELLQTSSDQLAAVGIENPQIDVELLAAHVLGISRGELQSKLFIADEISEIDAAKLSELVDKRVSRVPLQHLTGLAHFRNISLEVGPGVFIPRPETESVVELAIQALRLVPGNQIAVDLCSGSGAIAISIATEIPTAKVFAWELNPESEHFLRKNIERNNTDINLVMDDIANDHELFASLAGTVDLVISNPPYIPDLHIPRDPEVHLHDPKLALYGGADGMDVMKHVSKRALQLLKPGGFLVVEHADSQARIVADLFETDGWRQIRSHQDLTGRDRATTAVKAF